MATISTAATMTPAFSCFATVFASSVNLTATTLVRRSVVFVAMLAYETLTVATSRLRPAGVAGTSTSSRMYFSWLL